MNQIKSSKTCVVSELYIHSEQFLIKTVFFHHVSFLPKYLIDPGLAKLASTHTSLYVLQHTLIYINI